MRPGRAQGYGYKRPSTTSYTNSMAALGAFPDGDSNGLVDSAQPVVRAQVCDSGQIPEVDEELHKRCMVLDAHVVSLGACQVLSYILAYACATRRREPSRRW
jgi:hypothetical protein